MARFGKNVLSQYLRTKCDKQLRLSLYLPAELAAIGWPVPLTARPSVQILRDTGIEWEQAKMADLETAFGTNVRFSKSKGKFQELDLLPVLQQALASPTFILQPEFTHQNLKTRFLQSIGLDQATIDESPNFTSFRPDIIGVQNRKDDEVEILPDGNILPLQANDQRKALTLCDIKHAGEANSSYSAEVALYAVLLSNWLRLIGLEGSYLVSTRIALDACQRSVGLGRIVGDQAGCDDFGEG